MPDLQEPSRVLIGGMQTEEGFAAIQELVSRTSLRLLLFFNPPTEGGNVAYFPYYILRPCAV